MPAYNIGILHDKIHSIEMFSNKITNIQDSRPTIKNWTQETLIG